jgi:histidine triad (HIT) family protein
VVSPTLGKVPSPGECLICDKHAAADPGLEVHRDDLVYVGHLPALPDAYLGHLFVEPLEHRPGLADLSPEQAAAVGKAMRRAAVALRAAGHDHVYAFVFGDRVPHLHLHAIGRYPGAPVEYRGVRVDEWPDAPRGDASAVADCVERLRRLWAETG